MTSWNDAYSGEQSFMRVGYADGPQGVDIAVIGIPYDLGTTGRPGARFGPRAVRELSLAVGEFEWGVFPWDHDVRDRHVVKDLGDVTGFTAYPDRLCPAVEAKAKQVLDTGASLLSIGGDHFVSLPLLRAHAEKYGPMALIHFDAHSDTWVDEDLNHGTMFYHAIKEGIIDPARSVQVGLRTPNPETHGILILDADHCLRTPAADVAKAIRDRVGDHPAYVTFDIDFLDPAYAPATGTPVSGGPNTAYARHVLQGLAGLNIKGADQVEVAPHYEGPGQITAVAGATIAADQLYLLGLAREL
ncbi:agmatinase [Kordiimonas lacus]|uniref:Agmatinase n=1 Tax=Kordiimonas lacus TaxID=637679 RepID=A0A1G6VR65_9PROT|nr:agmatinase [Kordiimonas lacus]SDD55326.1 agmatinase [Kordiimonas lacus]